MSLEEPKADMDLDFDKNLFCGQDFATWLDIFGVPPKTKTMKIKKHKIKIQL